MIMSAKMRTEVKTSCKGMYSLYAEASPREIAFTTVFCSVFLFPISFTRTTTSQRYPESLTLADGIDKWGIARNDYFPNTDAHNQTNLPT